MSLFWMEPEHARAPQAAHEPPGPADHDRLGRYAGTALRAAYSDDRTRSVFRGGKSE